MSTTIRQSSVNAAARAARAERSTFETLAEVVRQALVPLSDNVKKVEAKVDELTRDHATRADLVDLRNEMRSAIKSVEDRSYPRGELDQRFQTFDQRVTTLNSRVTDMERTIDADVEQLRVELLGEIKEIKNSLKDQQSASLAAGERLFLRAGVVASIILALIELLPHIHLS